MKKNVVYIILAAIVGLLSGYLIFGSKEEPHKEMHEHIDKNDTSQKWTCSMHPQILKSEPGDCPICAMELIPVQRDEEIGSSDRFKMTQNAMALADIQTTVVGDSNIDSQASTVLSGKIVENQEANATQVSYFEGRIERLHVNYEGQMVKKGQKLATIYAPDLIAAQQELITAATLKESQPELYNAVRSKLKLWKLSEKQINAIELSGVAQEYFAIYATVSGTVSEVMSVEGDFVKLGQPIVRVSNLNDLWVEFDAYENQIGLFKKGESIEISTKAYPGVKLNTIISFVDPVLNVETRTYVVRAVISNKDLRYKPGMFALGAVKGMNISIDKQIVIPTSAVLWTGKRSVVYVKTNPTEPIFEMKEVVLGKQNNQMYTVIDGLKDGDEIVTNGTFTVDAAAQLQGKKSMMNRGKEEALKNNSGTRQDNEVVLSKVFQSKFKSALPLYIQMKNAFVKSDASLVSNFAKQILKKYREIEEFDLTAIEKKLLSEDLSMLKVLEEKQDIKIQRLHFVALSESMTSTMSMIDTFETTFYVQRCPMANNNKGAVWLSTEKEVENPYFGTSMLTCGSVIETF